MLDARDTILNNSRLRLSPYGNFGFEYPHTLTHKENRFTNSSVPLAGMAEVLASPNITFHFIQSELMDPTFSKRGKHG